VTQTVNVLFIYYVMRVKIFIA